MDVQSCNQHAEAIYHLFNCLLQLINFISMILQTLSCTPHQSFEKVLDILVFQTKMNGPVKQLA